MVKMSKSLVLLLILISLSFAALAVEDDCVYYFYGNDCEDCLQVNQHLQELEEKHPQLQIKKFEVYYEKDNYDLLQSYLDAYKIPEKNQGIPAIFMPRSYFIGKGPINELLEERIKDNKANSCPSLEEKEVIGIVGKSSSKSVLSKLTFSIVTGSALASSFSLGALALLLILLIILASIKDSEEMLKKGLFFIAGVYLAYLLFGLGLFTWLEFSGIGPFFSKLVGILAIITALALVKNFFVSWGVTFKNVSKSFKAKLKILFKVSFSSFGVLVIGFVAGLFSFTKFNKTFLLLRHLFVENFVREIAVPILLYYLIVFVLLMAVVVVVVYLLREKWSKLAQQKYPEHEKKAEMWKNHYLRVLNFVIYIILLVLGLVVLFV